MATWGIVGGGMLGASLALRLADAGEEVTLYETSSSLGGLASAWEVGEVSWDRFYHVTLRSDLSTISLLERLGLDGELRWVRTRSASWFDGSVYSMSHVLDYLRFPGLSLAGKARLALTIVSAARTQGWKPLENVSVETWLRRRCGDEVFERFWLPLLESKLGDAYQQTSAAFIWATIQRLYSARSAGSKTESFGYVPGGYARILGALSDELTGLGVDIRVGNRVASIVDGPRVVDETGEAAFDRVVVTTAPPLAVRLVPSLSAGERQQLNSLPYQGIVCPSVLLSGPLGGFYVTYLHDPAPFTSVIEMSAFVDPLEFGGRTLVYLPRYCAPHNSLFDESDESIVHNFVRGLKRVYPVAHDLEIEAFRVARARYVFPISTLGYSKQAPRFDTSVTGVHLVNSGQIINGTLNVNETIQLAERASRYLMPDVHTIKA